MRTSKKFAKRPRGRPPSHDPKLVQERVRDTFWEGGFSGTSLDELAAAAGVNRPTLYASFGDKHGMYVAALEQFMLEMRVNVAAALREPTLAGALRRFYASAIEHYVSGKTPRGCLIVCTASVEAIRDADVRRVLKRVLADVDSALSARIALAQQNGEIDGSAEPEALARLLAAVVHSIAVRARAGAPRAVLEQMAETAVMLACRAKPRAPRTRRGA